MVLVLPDQPLMVVIYYTCGLAETNRAPLTCRKLSRNWSPVTYRVQRYALGLFFLGEYGNMTIVSAIATYALPRWLVWPRPVAFLTNLNVPGWGLLGMLGILTLLAKSTAMLRLHLGLRSAFPATALDQLMQFAWLILIPTTLINILVTALIYLIVNSFGMGEYTTNLVFLIVTAVVNWAMLFAFIRIVGRATTATTRRASAPPFVRNAAPTSPDKYRTCWYGRRRRRRTVTFVEGIKK